MTCPFCKQPIPAKDAPLVHMVECAAKEAKRMDAFLANVVQRRKVEDYEIQA